MAADSDTLKSFEGNATRTIQKIRYDLLSPCFVAAIRRIATRATLGASIHGDRNWESGGPKFVESTKGHLLAHVLDYLENGNVKDDNLGAILWNAAALVHFEEKEKNGLA